uniref:Trehalose-phosphatase n=1 Tax=Oryza punctata TaxID=4537 RepID=A0A0E0LU09_ORYPU
MASLRDREVPPGRSAGPTRYREPTSQGCSSHRSHTSIPHKTTGRASPNYETLTRSKNVHEIHSKDSWNKGNALLDCLGLNSEDVLPIYIGDDTTDENALKVISQHARRFKILVSQVPKKIKETATNYILKDPFEVAIFAVAMGGTERVYYSDVTTTNTTWNKRNAVEYLLDSLGLNFEDVLPIYIENDMSDDNAFKVLRQCPRRFEILISQTITKWPK